MQLTQKTVHVDAEAWLESMGLTPMIPTPGFPRMPRAPRVSEPKGDRPTRVKRARVTGFTTVIPAHWDIRAHAIGESIRIGPQGGVRDLYFALCNALLARKLDPIYLPEVARRIGFYASSKNAEDKVAIAYDCIRRWETSKAGRGFRWLTENWPDVARVVHEQTLLGVGERLLAQTNKGWGEDVVISTIADAAAKMENVIRFPTPGGDELLAPCGTGKSTTMRNVACEKQRSFPQKPDGSWKNDAKTVIGVPQNRLALQMYDDFKKEPGIKIQRTFGPASLRNPDGSHVCEYYRQAAWLVQGHQSVQHELCHGGRHDDSKLCDHFLGCRATLGYEGDDDAPTGITPHALLKKTIKKIGDGAHVIIDEPPSYLRTTTFSVERLEHTLKNEDEFGARYRNAMYPLLDAVLKWTREIAVPVTGDEMIDFAEMVSIAAPHIDQVRMAQARRSVGDANADIIGCVREAFDPDSKRPGTAPPLRLNIDALRGLAGHAQKVGMASEVYSVLRDVATMTARVTVWVEERAGERCLSILHPDLDLAEILQRNTFTISDANSELHRPVVKMITGREPKLTLIHSGDAMPVTRAIYPLNSANKNGWFKDGRLEPTWGVVKAIGKAIDFANETPFANGGQLTLITFKQVRVAIEYTLGQRPEQTSEQWAIIKAEIEEFWTKVHGNLKKLPPFVEALRPVLTRWAGSWILGHYFATRGMNEAKDTDVIVAIGDPWQNRLSVQREAAYLGVDAEERAEQYVRAEYNQVIERGRSVQRTKPLRALIIGTQVPSSIAWTQGVEIRMAESESAVCTSADFAKKMDAARLSVPAMAVLLDCAERTVQRYRNGQTPVIADVYVRFEKAICAVLTQN